MRDIKKLLNISAGKKIPQLYHCPVRQFKSSLLNQFCRFLLQLPCTFELQYMKTRMIDFLKTVDFRELSSFRVVQVGFINGYTLFQLCSKDRAKT